VSGEEIGAVHDQVENFLRLAVAKYPGAVFHLDDAGLVLARVHDIAQSCESPAVFGDRDADGFICVRVDRPSDCLGGRVVWHRRWFDADNEKFAEFVRIRQETGESWTDFCETWDSAQEEALLHPEPFPEQLARTLGYAFDQRDR
jgi:hypothetical protein